MTSSPQSSTFTRGLSTTISYPRAIFGRKGVGPFVQGQEAEREQGLVVLLPGIEGEGYLTHSLALGLRTAGLRSAIELHDWTVPFRPGTFNLMMTGRARRQAAAIAEKLTDYMDAYPDRPVQLIGHSGGGAMIVHVLEELPTGRKINQAVLIAPAISSRYNLAAAMERVNGSLINVCSRLDWLFLGLGTWVFGTLDRQKGTSAGNCGFALPRHANDKLVEIYREKLQQISWRPHMLRDWHFGGHLSCMNQVFAERQIAPLIMAGEELESAPLPKMPEASAPVCPKEE